MLTPLDIQNKTFKKAINGYDKGEVDKYMELVLEDYEKLYKTSIESEDKINVLTKLVDSYKSMEDTMKNSIIVAQQTAEKVSKNADEKAQLIIDEANIRAKAITDEAQNKINELEAKLSELKTSMNMYKSQAEGMLKAQLETINDFKAE